MMLSSKRFSSMGSLSDADSTLRANKRTYSVSCPAQPEPTPSSSSTPSKFTTSLTWADENDAHLSRKAEWIESKCRKINGKFGKGRKTVEIFVKRVSQRSMVPSPTPLIENTHREKTIEFQEEATLWDSPESEKARQNRRESYNDLIQCRTILLARMFPRVSPRMLKALLLRNDADVDAVEKFLEGRGWESLRSKDIHYTTRYYVGQFAEDIVELMSWSPFGTYCTAFVASQNCYGLFYKDTDSKVQSRKLSSGPEISATTLKRFNLSFPLSRPAFRNVCDACGKNTPCTISEEEFFQGSNSGCDSAHKNVLRPFPVLIPDPSLRESVLILESLD